VRIINPDGTLGTQVSSASTFRGVAWTGDRYLALSYNSPITGQAFDVTGQPLGGAVAYGSGDGSGQGGIAISRPGGAFVGARDGVDGWLRTVDATGSPTAAPFYVNVGSNPQHRPIVIAGTNQYLAAWLDRRLGSYGIYAQRYDAAGNALDAIPILVLSEPTPTSERALAGASDGTDYLLVSSAYPGFAKRISSSGVVLDPAALALDMGTGSYSVSWDGVNYVVAGFTGSVRVKRVSGGGVILDPSPITVPVAGTTDHQISSSFNGTAHVILVRSFGTVYYVQLSPGGTVIGSPTTAGSFDPMPRIACRPTGTCLISNGETTKTLFPNATLSIPGAPSFTYGPPGVALGGNEYLLAAPSTEVSGIRLSTANPPVPIGSWFNISQSPATDEVAVSAASLGDGTSLVAYERYVEAESASRVYLRAIVLAAPNGAPCTAAADCQSAACVDGVCCNSACGNGANDCQACSIAAGASTDGTCAPIAAGTQCRASAGECDVAESCDGTATVCPADGVAGTDVVCRDAQGDCDVAETCNGLTASCPTNTFATAAVECRAANGDCDVAENCSGSGPNCPADTAAPSTTVCRASIGDCDAEETCDGTATTCPVDVAAAPTTVCRPAAGLCDAEETCGGAFECPADGVLPAGTSCRDAVHQCDVEDFCDGSSSACDNKGAPAETPCGGAPSGACDSPDTCSGGPGTENECVDWVYTETQVSRRAAGDCDQEERCTGFGPQCPTDKFISGEVCRGSQSTCDAEESCDGSGPECPADAAVPDGTQCEEGSVCAAGACVPESTGEAGGEPTTSTGSGSNDDDGGDGGDGAEDDSGCSCRTAGTRNASSPWALALLGIVVAARARRRVAGGHPSARSRAAGAGQMLRNN
jgi:MYXO-CTERM domain-containing protein